MPLKIEIIPRTKQSPIFLVLNDKTVWPIMGVRFNGAMDTSNPQFGQPFHMLKGCIFFGDVFGQAHKIDYDEANDSKPTSEDIWNTRLAALDTWRKKEGLPPETNPLKRMHPCELAKIPECDQPEWMKVSDVDLGIQ